MTNQQGQIFSLPKGKRDEKLVQTGKQSQQSRKGCKQSKIFKNANFGP